jgi:hypothetical protein
MCSEGCDVCSSLTFCLECSDDYFIQNGLCKPCQVECDQCTGTASNC